MIKNIIHTNKLITIILIFQLIHFNCTYADQNPFSLVGSNQDKSIHEEQSLLFSKDSIVTDNQKKIVDRKRKVPTLINVSADMDSPGDFILKEEVVFDDGMNMKEYEMLASDEIFDRNLFYSSFSYSYFIPNKEKVIWIIKANSRSGGSRSKSSYSSKSKGSKSSYSSKSKSSKSSKSSTSKSSGSWIKVKNLRPRHHFTGDYEYSMMYSTLDIPKPKSNSRDHEYSMIYHIPKPTILYKPILKHDSSRSKGKGKGSDSSKSSKSSKSSSGKGRN